MVEVKQIEEHVIPGKRLGRHIEHDPASRSYYFTDTPFNFDDLKNIVHRRYGSTLNQGDLGSCTGNATAHSVNSQGIHIAGKTLHETDAVSIYELATQLDEFPGQYPPDDTGSSGLAAAKAAQQKELIGTYKHAFSLEEAMTALQLHSVICGINWYEGFDNPNGSGLVTKTGQIRGGHEVCALGFERGSSLQNSLIVFQNSWGIEWGHHGRFLMHVTDFSSLLDEQGDVTILLPVGS